MIVVITITCNRIELTKKYLNEISKKAGIEFKHLIVDNGSSDGTIEYLKEDNYTVLSLKENVGILNAFKIGIDYAINIMDADFVVKFDNDIEILTDNILQKLSIWYKNGCDNSVIAPLDINILEHQMPRKLHEGNERGFQVRYVGHTGGCFQMIPKKCALMLLKEPDNEIIAGDLLRGRFWIKKGIDMIYLTELKIAHKGLENQTKNYKLA